MKTLAHIIGVIFLTLCFSSVVSATDFKDKDKDFFDNDALLFLLSVDRFDDEHFDFDDEDFDHEDFDEEDFKDFDDFDDFEDFDDDDD